MEANWVIASHSQADTLQVPVLMAIAVPRHCSHFDHFCLGYLLHLEVNSSQGPCAEASGLRLASLHLKSDGIVDASIVVLMQLVLPAQVDHIEANVAHANAELSEKLD